MDTTNKFFSGIAAARARLVLLAATFVAAIGFVAPVAATPRVVSVAVGLQSGPLTAPTGGSVTFAVTVGKRNSTETNNTNAVLTATGLPAGATASFVPPTLSWTIADTANKNATLTITTTAATPAAVTTFTVRAERTTAGSPAGNGDFASSTGALTVSAGPPQTPTITFGTAPTPTYLGGNFTVSATTNSNGVRTYSAVSGPCAVVNTSTGIFSSSGGGACVVRASTAATSTFLAGSAQQTVTIAPATPTITFGAAPQAEFPGANFTASATTNSNGALTYGYVSGTCTLVNASLGTFTPTAVGTCTIQASTAATTNFNAGSHSALITITPPATHLYAVAGTAALPGQTVPVWGYNSTNAAVTQPGGPTIVVNQGSTVTIALHNQLAAATGLLVQGQDMIPDTTGVPAGGTKTYTFTASRPGTYLYEAGLLTNAQHQVAMGLYGALIVRPPTPLQAYDNAATAYNDEAVLVLSEIDPALNTSASPATFDMRNYAPTYFLINGKPYPQTAPIASAPGNKVLLRYVNAGIKHHSMAVLGLRQVFVAKDASLLPTLNHNVVAETLAPGQTGDAITTVPAVTTASKFAVYDASLMLHNNGADNAFGGMLTFVTAGTGSGVTGPTTSAVALAPNPTNGSVSVALSASIQAALSTVAGAEYFIDTTGANGTGIAMGGTFGGPTAAATATLSTGQLAALAAGNHTVYVHGRNATGAWGAFSSAVLNLDKAGPATSGLTLTPNPSNGTVNVALSATGNDTASGGSNIVAAEYFIGTTPLPTVRGTTMSVNVAAPIASLAATIPCTATTPCTSGSVNVRSQDALGNWGSFATITLTVSAAGPVTSAVSAAPNPNNGTLPLSSGQPVVRVTATMTSAGSTVSGAEAFIDTAGAAGTGVPLAPSDGVWNGTPETGYADIPLATINALSNGNHTIFVRGRDAVGNWGATASTVLVIDKVPPTASSIARVGATPTNATSVAFTVTFSEAVTGVSASNFTLATSGVSGASIASVTGSGATRTVTVNTGIGSGTVGLNLTATTGVSDVAGNTLAATGIPLNGPTYTVDKTLPTFTSVTLTPNSIAPGTASIAFAVVGAADSGGSGLANAGEYWFDANAATAFAGTSGISAATGLLALGPHTLSVRIRDNVGNWSAVRTATLTVTGGPSLIPPTVAKSFLGAVRGGNGTQTQRTTTLTITLSNSNLTTAITGVGLIDNLPQPAGGFLASFTVVSSSTTCGGGTTSAQNLNRRLVLTGGTIPVNGNCAVTATVRMSGGATGAANGPYSLTNTITAGQVTSTNAGSNSAPASAVLTVNP